MSVPLAPGELASLCYLNGWRDARRLQAWLALLYAASGGTPDLIAVSLRPVHACERGDPVRIPDDGLLALAGLRFGPVWRVESPRTGILSRGPQRRQVAAVDQVAWQVRAGLSQLLLPLEDVDGPRRALLTQPGPHLREARRLLVTEHLTPWAWVPISGDHRDRARAEFVTWLQQEDPA